MLLATSLVVARSPIKKVPATSTETPSTRPSVTPPSEIDDVVAQVQAAVAEEEMKETLSTAVADFEIQKMHVMTDEEPEHAQFAIPTDIETDAADAVRRDTEETLSIVNQLNAIGGDLAPHESRYFNGWNAYPQGFGAYPGFNQGYNPGFNQGYNPGYNSGYNPGFNVGGWNGGWQNYNAGGYYNAFNPYRRNFYDSYSGAYNNGKFKQSPYKHAVYLRE